MAYQLGKGRPALAKLAAYKSILLALILAIIVTIVFLSVSSVLPALLTRDPTIQKMISELFPLIALGNLTMNMGMTAWALVGAQRRYSLATTIATIGSVLITVPLGAVLTVGMRIDLRGLTFAVVVGYTVTATLLNTVLLMSDWEQLSQKIREMAAEQDSDDDSDDDRSSSSSGSSSSSDDRVESQPSCELAPMTVG